MTLIVLFTPILIYADSWTSSQPSHSTLYADTLTSKTDASPVNVADAQGLFVTGDVTTLGKVGIGTTTPGKLLDVNVGTSGNGIRITRDASIYLDLFQYGGWQENGFSIDPSGNKGIFLSSNDGDVIIGSVALGPSSAPASKLTVAGGVNIGYAPNTAAPSNGLIVSGNVGIGTTSPSEKLEVSNGNIKVTRTTSGGKQGLIMLNSGVAKPACDATIQGAIVYEQNLGADNGHFFGCRGTGGGSYAWVQLD